MKICSKCQTPKPAAQFRKDPRYAGGRFCWCHECVHAYGSNPEKLKKDRARRKRRFADPKERATYNAGKRAQYATPRGKRRHKDEIYQRKYGISLDFFESEVKKQKRCCRLCGKRRRLVADHNHKTGKYRGAICGICNVAIGRIELVPDFILKVQEYIQ
jgi:hypothetical protein